MPSSTISGTAPKRIAALGDVPTIAEQGFPELVVPGEDWMGFLVKSGTPDTIVTRLNQEQIRTGEITRRRRASGAGAELHVEEPVPVHVGTPR